MEEEDLKILNDPEGYVVQTGGEIFFALTEEDTVVGCAAMILSNGHQNPNDDDDKNGPDYSDKPIFELGKMAVAPHMRGKGISKLLMDACLQFARQENAQAVCLLTDDSLKAAMALYLKSGFVRLPRKKDQRYARGDVEMWMTL